MHAEEHPVEPDEQRQDDRERRTAPAAAPRRRTSTAVSTMTTPARRPRSGGVAGRERVAGQRGGPGRARRAACGAAALEEVRRQRGAPASRRRSTARRGRCRRRPAGRPRRGCRPSWARCVKTSSHDQEEVLRRRVPVGPVLRPAPEVGCRAVEAVQVGLVEHGERDHDDQADAAPRRAAGSGTWLDGTGLLSAAARSTAGEQTGQV